MKSMHSKNKKSFSMSARVSERASERISAAERASVASE